MATILNSNSVTPDKSVNRQKIEIPIWKKLNITIKEAAAYSNIGQNKISEFLKLPRCTFVLYIGNKKLVKFEAFGRFVVENMKL